MFAMGVTFLVYCLVAILAMLGGVLAVDEPLYMTAYVSFYVGLIHLPMTLLGWRVMNRRVGLLWLSTTVAGMFATASATSLVQWPRLGVGGEDGRSIVILNTLIAGVATTVFLYQLIAIHAVRANREAFLDRG